MRSVPAFASILVGAVAVLALTASWPAGIEKLAAWWPKVATDPKPTRLLCPVFSLALA